VSYVFTWALLACAVLLFGVLWQLEKARNRETTKAIRRLIKMHGLDPEGGA
jgi:hypothetical protein